MLLTPAHGHWRLADQYVADCLYRDQVSIDFAPLAIPGQNDILVHYDCYSHGTGYVEHHLHILSIEGNRLKDRFQTVEHLYAAGWQRDAEQGAEEVHFFIPIRQKNGSWALEDTKQITPLREDEPQTERRRVERRVIQWSSRRGRFIASPFRQVR